jgi:hypothetical protein
MLKPKHVRMGESTRTLLLSRFEGLAKKHPIARTVERQIGDLFLHQISLDQTLGKVQERADYGFLNDAGRLDARRKALQGTFKERAKAQRELEGIAKNLGNFVPKVKQRESTDVIGEMQDQEIRRVVRETGQNRRMGSRARGGRTGGRSAQDAR